MSRLETELQEMFAAKSRQIPLLRDQLDVVVRRSRRIRRRRRAVLAAAVVMVLAVSLLTGFSVLKHNWSLPPASRSPLLDSVERIVDGVLITPAGEQIDLVGDDQITWAARVPDGLLYLTGGAGLLLRYGGGTHTIATPVGGTADPVVSRDGRMVGVGGHGTKVLSAILPVGDARLAGPGSNSREAKVPIGWHGYRLVIAGSSGSGNPRYWDWDTAKKGESAREIRLAERIEILGAIQKGRWFLGVSRVGKQFCLVRLDPAQAYAVVADLCALAPGLDVTAFSTDGRYMSVSAADMLRIYDLQTLFDSPRPQAIEGCPPSSKVTWIDDRTLASGNVICRVDDSGKITTARLPAPPKGAKVVYVTRYGV